MDVALVNPQIAPNTGNIIRLCANVGARLHLVEPLGFALDNRLLRRGGLDYHEFVDMQVHSGFEALADAVAGRRLLALTGAGATRYDQVEYLPDDVLVFGCEASGLQPDVLATFDSDHRVAIPMMPDNRSLNLGNAVAVVAYEAWRQLGFAHAASTKTQAASTLEAIAHSRVAD